MKIITFILIVLSFAIGHHMWNTPYPLQPKPVEKIKEETKSVVIGSPSRECYVSNIVNVFFLVEDLNCCPTKDLPCYTREQVREMLRKLIS